MGRQKHTAEQIISKLREAEVLQAKGTPMEEVLRQLSISDATYYKWRKEYGGLRIDHSTAAAQPRAVRRPAIAHEYWVWVKPIYT